MASTPALGLCDSSPLQLSLTGSLGLMDQAGHKLVSQLLLIQPLANEHKLVDSFGAGKLRVPPSLRGTESYLIVHSLEHVFLVVALDGQDPL